MRPDYRQNPRYHKPTPAWVMIGLLTSFLILILQTTLFTNGDDYASFIVSLTYTTAIMITCSLTMLGHLLVRRYPRLEPYLNIDIDLASAMTLRQGGGIFGGAGGRMTEAPQGRRRASIGEWVNSAGATPTPLQRAATRDSDWDCRSSTVYVTPATAAAAAGSGGGGGCGGGGSGNP